MIRNFEEYTHEMTGSERIHVIPFLIQRLTLTIGKEKALTNKKLVSEFNFGHIFIKTSGPRVRHLIHVLRASDTIPLLLANSKGYYISDDKEEIETYIGSVEDRIRAIYQIRRALKRQLDNSRESEDGIQFKLVLK